MTRQETIEKSLALFEEGYACSQAVLLTFSAQFGMDDQQARLISSTFGGGMGRLRQKCGAVTGGFMVLGLACGNANPKDMDTKLAAYAQVRTLNEQVETIHGTTVCAELLEKHTTPAEVQARNHHQIICRKVIADTVGLVYDMVHKAQSGN